ncbi:MAG: hypothetical protein GY842_06275 [bacterium]|nr:hypothetical protein [bacterium]
MAKPDQEMLLRLYDLVVREEHYFLDAYQVRVGYYTRLVLAIAGVTVVGLYLASYTAEWYHFAALCVGPVLIYALSATARDGCYRFYRRYLEAVTSRAKIEQELDLSTPRPEAEERDHTYWANEPYVPPRHVTARKRHRSSEEFIRSSMRRGFHRWNERLLRGFEVFSGVAFVGLLFLTVLRATESFSLVDPAQVEPPPVVAPVSAPETGEPIETVPVPDPITP